MNWKRGVERLLIVVFAAAGLAVLLVRASGLKESGVRQLLFVWFVFLLFGVAGYCFVRLLELIVYFSMRALKIQRGKVFKGKTIRGELRELTLISALICSGVLFFLCYAVCSKGINPDYLLAFIASCIVFVISFGLVWGVYGVIFYVVTGFIGGGLKAASGSENEE